MKTIQDYSIREHGVMLPDYFQGQGTANTNYDSVATGIGETAEEAFNDACEQLATDGWDTKTIVCPDYSKHATVSEILTEYGIEQDGECEDSSYWFISILVR